MVLSVFIERSVFTLFWRSSILFYGSLSRKTACYSGVYCFRMMRSYVCVWICIAFLGSALLWFDQAFVFRLREIYDDLRLCAVLR